jgi:toxin CcdB
MKQFEVFANPFPRSRQRQPFLVALQSDLLARNLDTTIVAPLEPVHSSSFADRLNPPVTVEGGDYVVVMQELVTVRKSVLGKPRASIAEHRDAIVRALDLLFTGF